MGWEVRGLATLRIENAELVIGLSIRERFAALRRDVRVPPEAVYSVAVEPHPFAAIRGTRLSGSSLPAAFAYGSWLQRDASRDFYALNSSVPAVRVAFDPSAPYRRLLVSVADPQAAVDMLRAAVPSLAGPGAA